ncbi:MarR family winged helix-turn-helix transcriptional regulator [Amycolatopsis nigrescens]|uniref:MarR family winged helix-turn-helix transcriptional regulator n=1 Tax=Amycolatopsis nigrescens TaxID=381445 RepID=UPI0003A3BE66|nr:MarR family transcriptional regulator [Amycolatopsis nigrescens]
MARRGTPSPDAVDLMLEQWRYERPELDTAPMAVLGRLQRAHQRYQAQAGRLFTDFGLTGSSFAVLASLRRAGAPYRCTAGELADTNLVTTGGITQQVDRLLAAGLVRRERDTTDRRVVYVTLTEEGLLLVDRLSVLHFAQEQRMLGELSTAEQAQLARLLSRLEHSLNLAGAAEPAEAVQFAHGGGAR